ncbi:MAG: DinB family protein [Gemmatimonadaceae bacterium]
MELTRVAPFLEYLQRVHERSRRVIARIPPEQLEWAPAPGKFSFGDLVRHLAAIERYMYAETVNGRPSIYPGHGRELADGCQATIAFYDRLHDESLQLFGQLTDARLTEKCLTPAGSPISVGKWLRAMIEHEAHHRGQIYLMLSMVGVSTPPLYGLTEEEVQQRSGH